MTNSKMDKEIEFPKSNEIMIMLNAMINGFLVDKPLSGAATTAFTCIRLCFGKLDYKAVEKKIGRRIISNGEFDLIFESAS